MPKNLVGQLTLTSPNNHYHSQHCSVGGSEGIALQNLTSITSSFKKSNFFYRDQIHMVRDVDHLREEHDHVVGIGDREETTVADVVVPNPVAGDLL